MSLYNGPPRGGARGGKDQFSWESVKSDKDREFYLGHSVKASVGRWQKGKDLFWYTRDKKDDADAAIQSELATVKAREEELMMEALGLKPKAARPKTQPQLDQLEMKKLLEGGDEEEDDQDEARKEADQIKGIGFRSGQIIGAGDAGKEVMAGVGLGRSNAAPPGNPGPSTAPNQQLPPPPKLSEKDLKKLKKAQKRELRKAKKKAKKAKKAAKREAKRAKAADQQPPERHESSSDSSSESDAHSEDSPPRAEKRARVLRDAPVAHGRSGEPDVVPHDRGTRGSPPERRREDEYRTYDNAATRRRREYSRSPRRQRVRSRSRSPDRYRRRRRDSLSPERRRR